MKYNNRLIDILNDQVKPALGCTEPGAVAYAVARSKEIIGAEIKNLRIVVNKNILKNGLAVGIPGTKEHGLAFAAALSLVIGKSEYSLEVLKDVDAQSIKSALELVDSNIISIELDKKYDNLYISVEAFGYEDNAKVVIENSHTNIVFQSKNDVVLYDNNNGEIEEDIVLTHKPVEIKYEIKNYSFNDLIEFADEAPLDSLSFIQDGIDMNLNLALVGITEDLGVGMGKYFYNSANDIYSRAKAYTAAASEARMCGYLLPVMSSAGSGNHGLVAIIPISYIGQGLEKSREMIIRSIVLSHLITIYVKAHIGALSPVCGCGVAAGVGCAAGLTYLMKGSSEQINSSIKNMIAGVTGMICDGAKLGCSYKLAIAVDAAVDASNMAIRNIFIPSDNGILAKTAEDTILNLAEVSNLGMNNTDNIILDVMLQKC